MNDERYERFEQAVSALPVGNGESRERWLGRLGVLLMAAGPIVGLVAYLGSVGTVDPAVQRDMGIVGLLGVSLSVVGAGLFVRYSVVRYFRYWAARLTFEVARPRDPAGNPVFDAPEGQSPPG